MGDAAKAMVEKMSRRLAEALRSAGNEELASRVEAAATKVAANDDGAYWSQPRLQPKVKGHDGFTVIAQVVLIEQMQADGLSDEECDPIRDVMDDLY